MGVPQPAAGEQQRSVKGVSVQAMTNILDWTRGDTPERQLGFVVATSNFQILDVFQNFQNFQKKSNFLRQLAL